MAIPTHQLPTCFRSGEETRELSECKHRENKQNPTVTQAQDLTGDPEAVSRRCTKTIHKEPLNAPFESSSQNVLLTMSLFSPLIHFVSMLFLIMWL